MPKTTRKAASDDFRASLRKIRDAFKENADKAFVANTILMVQKYLRENQHEQPFEEWDVDSIIQIVSEPKI